MRNCLARAVHWANMTPLPPELEREREELIREIHAAFADVSREGGVSWSEAEVIDGYGTEEEKAAARRADKDRSWTELVDNRKWDPGFGIGGYCFLDAIGFRYYLPPAMIRCIRSGFDEGIAFHLTREGRLRHMGAQWSLLDQRQQRCVARFLRFMVAHTEADGDEFFRKRWDEPLQRYWEGVS